MSRDTRRRERMLFVAACGLELMCLAVLTVQRNVNADEGFYLVAGLRVLEGKTLYRDFFFPQMPYLPFAEALMMAVTGPSLLAMRWIGVISGALVAGLIAVVVARQARSLLAGAVVAAAYASHSLLLNYLSIIKTYGISNLGLVAAFALLAFSRKPRRLASFTAGMAAGIALGTRLPTAVAVLVLLLWVWGMGRRYAVAFCGGALLTSLPWLWTIAESPEAFWFCNVGFHSLRREIHGFLPLLTQKLEIVAKWTLLPQNLVLWAGAVGGAVLAPRLVGPALACVAGLSLAYLAATPTYLDYMVQIIPFLLLAAAPVLPYMAKRPVLIALVLMVWVGGIFMARRDAPDASVRGAKARLWNAAAVAQVASFVEENSNPDDRILSWWEGYPALANREGYVGVGFWESNVSRKLSAEERQRYHILHPDDLRDLILAGDPRLVVFQEGVWGDLQPALRQRYVLAHQLGEVRIFARRSDAAS